MPPKPPVARTRGGASMRIPTPFTGYRTEW